MISVIVCTYNRQKYIGACLEHMANQSASSDQYEVIVIDNNSTDETARIAAQAIEQHPEVTINYFLEKSVGLSHARNRGIQEAKGDILSFIDDDAFADHGYVKAIGDYFADHQEVSAIGGKIIPEYEDQEPQWMSKFLLPLVAAVDMGDKPRPFPGSKFPIGANMAFRKSVFTQLGTFDPALGRIANELGAGEEKDLFIKLKSADQQIHYVPTVLVRHIIPEKRLEADYIRRMGRGVGRSEKMRLQNQPKQEIVKKIASELIKVAGTAVLFMIYSLQLRFQAASMVVKFRFWVLQGYLQ